MRVLVLGLVLLAGFKVWMQDRTYRTAMSDALIEAYRDRAIEVCRRQSPRRATLVSTAAGEGPWGSASEAQIIIGNPDLDVAIWDTENPLWGGRFRHPHLVLTATGEGRGHCAYDVADGVATLSMH